MTAKVTLPNDVKATITDEVWWCEDEETAKVLNDFQKLNISPALASIEPSRDYASAVRMVEVTGGEVTDTGPFPESIKGRVY